MGQVGRETIFDRIALGVNRPRNFTTRKASNSKLQNRVRDYVDSFRWMRSKNRQWAKNTATSISRKIRGVDNMNMDRATRRRNGLAKS